MKKIIFVLIFALGYIGSAQTKSELQNHYEAFYNEMRLQGDVDGVINALTHLNVMSPSIERRDTLAYVYANDNQHMQALNTIGIEKNDADSDLALQVKAISLKALNQPKRALEQFELLFKRSPNSFLAYELADLKIQTGDSAGATANIEYGITNVTDDMTYAFYERQQPYDVSLKAAFLHLKGLIAYNSDKNNIDAALAYINEALTIEPSFNLASLSKQALESRKEKPEAIKEVPEVIKDKSKAKKQ
ncbi:MAG: tetratricopeptide (TPR) repeat protein [Psychroserpens sp.]|jgi:tetratricopeptide (TPR) repeat protein